MTTSAQTPVCAFTIPAPVTSLALNKAGNLLVGSDDGSLRVYDMSTRKVIRAARGLGSEVSSITCMEDRAESVWLACGRKAILLPTVSGKLVLTADDATKHLTLSEDKDDALNKLALNDSNTHLAYSLDSGVVGVIDIKTLAVHTMRQKHDSICASVLFIPNRPRELVSAGYDSALLHFDFLLCDKLSKRDMPPFSDIGDDTVSLSPPFIMTTSMSSSGILAAGAADGRLWIGFGGEKRQGPQKSRKKTRKWEGLDDRHELLSNVAEGPIVALVFISSSTLVFSTLLGRIKGLEITEDALGARAVKTVFEHQAQVVHKVNDLAVDGGNIYLAGLNKDARGVVEICKNIWDETSG